VNKNWIVFFGILDLLKIEKVITLIAKLIKGEITLHFLNIFGIIFCGIVFATGLLLIFKKRIGYILSYIEFPFRLFFAYFTFSFLLWINEIIESENILIFTIVLALLEIGRLLITIKIHRQEIKNARP
jgi:hypothetical protein